MVAAEKDSEPAGGAGKGTAAAAAGTETVSEAGRAAAGTAAQDGAGPGAPAGEPDWKERAEEYYNQFLRARADYENLARRTQRDVATMVRLGKRDLLLKLLDLSDNLERAVSSWRSALAAAGGVDPASLSDGVAMIGRQLQAVLAAEGVQPVQAVGQPFDPSVHEAVAAWESPDVGSETVSDEIRKGYTYQGELLRAAQVRVARPPA
jgi:molecular chaperone GrpE